MLCKSNFQISPPEKNVRRTQKVRAKSGLGFDNAEIVLTPWRNMPGLKTTALLLPLLLSSSLAMFSYLAGVAALSQSRDGRRPTPPRQSNVLRAIWMQKQAEAIQASNASTPTLLRYLGSNDSRYAPCLHAAIFFFF